MVLVFKNVGERSTAKSYRHVGLLSVVIKVFEKLLNKRIVDHLEKSGIFSDFHYGFSKAFIKPFEAPQRRVKIKISVDFFFVVRDRGGNG